MPIGIACGYDLALLTQQDDLSLPNNMPIEVYWIPIAFSISNRFEVTCFSALK
ncbi:MAG: hypothetical protein ACI90A_000849 [Shewanella sp.]|jgi:hypothetical protein